MILPHTSFPPLGAASRSIPWIHIVQPPADNTQSSVENAFAAACSALEYSLRFNKLSVSGQFRKYQYV